MMMEAKDLIRVLAIVRKEVGEQFARVKIPKDGLDGRNGDHGRDAPPLEQIQSFIRAEVSNIPVPRPGRDAVIPLETIRSEVQAAVAKLPKPKPPRDGIDGKNAVVDQAALASLVRQHVAAIPMPEFEIGDVRTVNGTLEHPKVEIERSGNGYRLKFAIPVWRNAAVDAARAWDRDSHVSPLVGPPGKDGEPGPPGPPALAARTFPFFMG